MKQEMKNYLIKEGYLPEDSHDGEGLIFKREGLIYYVFNHKKEEKYFSVALPGIYDATLESRPIVLEAANRATQRMRVGKVIIIDDTVWCVYEQFLTSQNSFDEIFPRAFWVLSSARIEFYNILEGLEDSNK